MPQGPHATFFTWKKHKNDVEEHMDFEKKIHEEYEHESKNNDKNQH